MIRIDAYYASSCHARYIDEALTEEEENCCFELLNNRNSGRTTPHPLWSRVLAQERPAMFLKYQPTLKTTIPTALLQWQAMLVLCSEASQIMPVSSRPSRHERTEPYFSLLQVRDTHTPQPPTRTTDSSLPPTRALSKYQQRLHRRRKELHAQRVARGIIPPTRQPPATTPPYIFNAAAAQSGWTRTYTSYQPVCGSLCIMSWSCNGRLYSPHQQLNQRPYMLESNDFLSILARRHAFGT